MGGKILIKPPLFHKLSQKPIWSSIMVNTGKILQICWLYEIILPHKVIEVRATEQALSCYGGKRGGGNIFWVLQDELWPGLIK
jgi:hypothetical protein